VTPTARCPKEMRGRLRHAAMWTETSPVDRDEPGITYLLLGSVTILLFFADPVERLGLA